MSEEQLRQLQRQLWSIADALRGKMNADEFRDYILGFIFYKYLSEKMVAYANKILVSDNLIYDQLKPSDEHYNAYISAVKNSIVKELGYFLTPAELFQRSYCQIWCMAFRPLSLLIARLPACHL